MKELSKRGKRIIAAIAAVVIGAAAVFGIGTAVRRTTSASVPVIQVSSIDYGLWLDWENSVSGVITSDAEQSIYLSDTEKVKEVLVTEGQAVHKGDVLMKYDTKSTKLNLEKEKVNRERIELGIEVARENIRTLENISPISDGGDGIYLPGDLLGIEAFEEVLKKAEVYKKTLKADAKPANEDPEDETLGTEDNPYLFLCEGDSVTITKDFIKRWQRIAKKAKMKKLFIALQKRDKNMELQRAWMTDVMLLDPEYALRARKIAFDGPILKEVLRCSSLPKGKMRAGRGENYSPGCSANLQGRTGKSSRRQLRSWMRSPFPCSLRA